MRAAKDERTPSQLAAQLREFCIGQDAVVDSIAVAVYQHLSRCGAAASGMPIISHLHIPPILLIGPTGCGKSTLMRAIGTITGLPVHTESATRITEDGWMGLCASDLVRSLLAKAEGHVGLAEHGVLLVDEIDKKASAGTVVSTSGRDVSGTGAQDALLHLIEGGNVTVDVPGTGGTARKRLPIRTNHMLIAAAGACDGLEDIIQGRISGPNRIGFGAADSCDASNATVGDRMQMVEPQDLIEYGLKRELVGRFERLLVMSELSDGALRGILCDARDGPIRTQQKLAMQFGFRFEFSSNLIDLIVDRARRSGLGARSLWGLVSAATERAWYEVPDRRRDEKQYPWGRTVVRLRTDSLTGNYYGLSVTDKIILADSEEGRARTVESATSGGR